MVSIYREDVKTRRRKVAGAMSWLRYFLLWIPIEVASNAQFPGAQPSEPTLLQGIEYDKFEPAVAEQIRLAREETRHKPRDAEAFGKLGMIFQVYGKYELAETCYGRARALAPRSFRWTYYLGNVEGWLGKYSEAVSYVQEALTIDPGYAPARVRLAQLLFESGDMEQSARLYEELSEKNPGLASAHFGLGRVRSARGDWTGAIEAYRRACRISENYAAAHYALGLAYRKVDDVVKAREHLGRYERVKLLPQPSEDALMDVVKSFYAGGLSHFARGSALVQQGKLQEAAAAFESALKVNPRMGIAHVNLIAIYGELNLPEKAEQHYRDSVQLDPGWVEAQYNWGMFLFRQGRKEEAAQAFRRAVQLNPNYADAQAQPRAPLLQRIDDVLACDQPLGRLLRALVGLVGTLGRKLARQQPRIGLQRHAPFVAGVQPRQMHAGLHEQWHAGMHHVRHRRVDPFHRRARAGGPVTQAVREFRARGPRVAEGGEGVADLLAREARVVLHQRQP